MSQQGREGASLWTPANIVTLIRICLVPVFVIVLISPWPQWLGIHDVIDDHVKAIIAAGVFVVISCTDWIDGYLARSRNEVTDFGKFIDPLADKILVAAALIALVELQVIPSWPVLIILTREFIVSGIRMVAASKGCVIAASWYGKAKTVLQIVAIVLFIVKDSLFLPTIGSVMGNPLYVVSWIVMIAALVMTILSMLDYIAKARPILFPAKENEKSVASDTEKTSKDSSSSTSLAPFDGQESSTSRSMTIEKLASEVVSAARAKGVKIATAESLTGGLIAATLTSIPGSSKIFMGSVVSYALQAKHDLLGVNEHLLNAEGAVNEQTAKEMAEGAAKQLDADIAVAVTGIAGPGGAETNKPVGTVFMGLCANGIVHVSHHCFEGSREDVRTKTLICALNALGDAIDSR